METNDDIGEATTTKASGRDGVGMLLRTRRVELGMSHADVASVVKMSTRRIIAIEDERWEELPDGPYLRGFLRNIARALQLDATTLIDRVDDSLIRSRNPDSILVPPTATHVMLPRRSGPMDGRQSGRMLVYGAFVFASIAALIAWSGTSSFDRVMSSGRAMIAAQSKNHDEPAAKVVEPEAASDASASPSPASVAADGPAPQSVAGTTDAVAAASASSVQSAASSSAPASDLALSFRFNEPSWVEVRAADGKVLLQRLNAAGSEQQVEGSAPFSLIVGNAKGVEVRFHGRPVDLTPFTRDQVARLTLS